MGLKTNTIITLENQEKYVVLNETMYGGVKYFLVMGVTDNGDIVSDKVKILEEYFILGTNLNWAIRSLKGICVSLIARAGILIMSSLPQ